MRKNCVECNKELSYPGANCYANAMALSARKQVGICLDCCPTTSPLPEKYRHIPWGE